MYNRACNNRRSAIRTSVNILHFFHNLLCHVLHFMPDFFHAALFSCCAFIMLYFFHVALFSCCTISMSHFFSCFTFSYHFVHDALFPYFYLALFSRCPISKLHFFHVALFFRVALFFLLLLFILFCFLFCFYILRSFFDARCTFFILHFFNVSPCLCCTAFVFCTLSMWPFFHAAPFFLCCALFTFQFFHVAILACHTFSLFKLIQSVKVFLKKTWKTLVMEYFFSKVSDLQRKT